MKDTVSATMPPSCPWCGLGHWGEACHLVKAIEFYPDGMVKRVEFITGPDPQPIALGDFKAFDKRT